MNTRAVLCVLWPSFLMAGIGSAVVFAFIDPLDIAIFGYMRPEREWLYALGFFLLWAVGAGASALTQFMRPDKQAEAESEIGF
jgi:hypothetical protein